MAIKRDHTLDAKYREQDGVVFLSGIQALVRLPLDQHLADRRRGLNMATLISFWEMASRTLLAKVRLDSK